MAGAAFRVFQPQQQPGIPADPIPRQCQAEACTPVCRSGAGTDDEVMAQNVAAILPGPYLCQ